MTRVRLLFAYLGGSWLLAVACGGNSGGVDIGDAGVAESATSDATATSDTSGPPSADEKMICPSGVQTGSPSVTAVNVRRLSASRA